MTDEDAVLAGVADALAAQGWAVMPGFIDAVSVSALQRVAAARHAAGEFRGARVGRAEGAMAAPTVRSDRIRWLSADDPDPDVSAALARLDALRITLNRKLFLGLERLEAHFAAFAPGARYGVHVDRFRDDDARVVSVVLYLNVAWTAADGGALRLYLETAGAASMRDIDPAGGTLVTFLSERFAHEVLPARRDRWSLTGWFRRRVSPLDIE